MKKTVGLLWDSVSYNTGDIAIGMVNKRFCETRNIDYSVLNPFYFNPDKYSTIIVGGGQLLRGSEDVFYRCFRVPGPHILNSVGIHHPNNLDYLNNYRLISVRSQAEKLEISKEYPDLDIQVRPCLTIQFGKYFESEIIEKANQIGEKHERIGIHLNNTTLRLLPDLVANLQELNKTNRLMFIPFTHYQNDRKLMQMLTKWLPGSEIFWADDPISIFAVVGTLKAMISSSMHAALFAYVQNVPVLAFPQDHKIKYFFEERGFPQSLYTSSENLLEDLNALFLNRPDYSDAIKSDKCIVDKHLCQVEEIVKNPQNYRYSKDTRFYDIQLNKMQESFYLSTLQTMMDLNYRETDILDLTLQNRALKSLLINQNNDNFFTHLRLWLKKPLLMLIRCVKYLQLSRLILSSGLFDEKWYLNQYPDIVEKNINSIWHYLFWGGFENRDPGPDFSSNWYLTTYKDVAQLGMNPLVHYLKYGKSEGRCISGHY